VCVSEYVGESACVCVGGGGGVCSTDLRFYIGSSTKGLKQAILEITYFIKKVCLHIIFF
jgi:hypothetical protein